MTNAGSNNISVLDISALLISTAGIFSAMIYLAGWSFVNTYFKNFGIGLLELNLPHEFVLVYGGWVIQDYGIRTLFLSLVCGCTLLAVFLLTRRYFPRLVSGFETRFFVLLIAPMILALASILLYSYGRFSANNRFYQHQSHGFKDFPSVEIVLKDPVHFEHAEQLRKGCYRSVLNHSGRIYLIFATEQAPDKVAVIVLPDEQVRSIHILPFSRICE